MEPKALGTYPFYLETIKASKGLNRILLKILPIPLHIFFPLRAEIYMAWIRLKSWHIPWKYKRAHDLLVNLGSGSEGRAGWVNIDIIKFPEVNCIYDVRKKLPFPDGSVQAIFCEHFFEHLDYTEEVPYFLSEVYRVLKTGGIFRVVVPDIEKYLRGYCEDGWDTLIKVRPLNSNKIDGYYKFQYRTKMELINMLFRQGYRHKYAYDFETIQFLLSHYGFEKVYRQAYQKSLMTSLVLDCSNRASESLYVEAVKC